ncbi:hypothetical protein BT63DRAFT_420284 [Microthyrium microscopicum]|uniref:Uncharacterized protein n=1 Tax=Microthyrium microscopicum TaxID=703497 RepID=A0A6A6UTB5_9PEZI|nr:hypothetical protein BT63DRAFT_420284 [Microthyrium microscopicum]
MPLQPSPIIVQKSSEHAKPLLSPPLLAPPSLPHSPRRSSPLKHRLDLDEEEDTTVNNTMASDVRQLQHETRAAKRPALERNTSPKLTQPRPPPRPHRTSLLKSTQKRLARAAMEKSSHVAAVDNSIFSRISSLISPDETSINASLASATDTISPPDHPNHPLLQNFRMLPQDHPWTDDHFQALLSLYKHWLLHEDMYSPRHAINARLITPEWSKLINMSFSNWGYEMLVTEGLVVIAALFEQLLRLRDQAEFEELYGAELRIGVVGARTVESGPISKWHIALRLFTVMVGDLIRADERKGVPIDRTPKLKWRYRDQWLWRRGWFSGLL